MTVILDPYGPETGYSVKSFGDAQVVTVSHEHPGHSNVTAVGGQPRVINGPGEYEIAGVLITGVQTFHDGSRGAKLGRNTAYIVEMDDVRICHLGDLGHVPTPAQAEAMGRAEVLLVPVGGHTTIDATAAAEVVSLLEPRVVVPMHFHTDASKDTLDPLDRSLKQMGLGEVQSTNRLTVTRTNLPVETTVSVLDYRR
jgi:L-ascorbate metabolism protein UlaG (beta-lactamase superfamily)